MRNFRDRTDADRQLAVADARSDPDDDETPVVACVSIAVQLPADGRLLEGLLDTPDEPRGIVVFAHGSGSSRHSVRNRAVARRLRAAAFATLLLDLLTESEAADRALVFDTPLLGRRLVAVTQWVRAHPQLRTLPIGLFGASTGAGAALRAAADPEASVRAVVSRGGRPDLADDRLAAVRCPTLLLVGSRDPTTVANNEAAAARLQCEHRLVVVPGATHLFEEPGALELVARFTTDWFAAYLPEPSGARSPFGG